MPLLVKTIIVFALLLSSNAISSSSVEDLESIVSKANSYKEFLSNRELLLEYKKAVELYYLDTSYNTHSFWDIIRYLRKLDKEIPEFGQSLWHKSSKTFRYEIERVPSEKASSSKKATLLIRTLPRKLHGIWINTTWNTMWEKEPLELECTIGDIIAPSRWAIGLKNSELFLIERNGLFSRHSILVVPLRRDGNEFLLVSTFGTAMTNKPYWFKTSRNSQPRKTSLMNLWLEKTGYSELKNLVRVKAPKNNGRIFVVQLNAQTQRNKVVGTLNEFGPTDSTATKISMAAHRACYSKGQTKTMNIWGGFSDNAIYQAPSDTYYDDTQEIKSLLKKINDPSDTSILKNVPSQKYPRLQKQLSNILLNSKNPTLREKAALALNLLKKKMGELNKNDPRSLASLSPYSSKSKPPYTPDWTFQSPNSMNSNPMNNNPMGNNLSNDSLDDILAKETLSPDQNTRSTESENNKLDPLDFGEIMDHLNRLEGALSPSEKERESKKIAQLLNRLPENKKEQFFEKYKPKNLKDFRLVNDEFLRSQCRDGECHTRERRAKAFANESR